MLYRGNFFHYSQSDATLHQYNILSSSKVFLFFKVALDNSTEEKFIPDEHVRLFSLEMGNFCKMDKIVRFMVTSSRELGCGYV